MQDSRIFRTGMWLTIAYLVLEWIEHAVYRSSHDVAPWDPSSGIAFAALLLGGWRYSAVIILGEIGAALPFTESPARLPEAIYEITLVFSSWGIAAAFLRRSIDIRLTSQYDLFILIVVTAIAALVHALAQVALTWGSQPPPLDQAYPLVARSWVGDMIGVMVLTPAALVRRVRSSKMPFHHQMEILVLLAVTAAVLWLNFTRLSTGGLQLFFLLFLPGIWVSARFGLIGAIGLNLVMHGCLAIAFALLVKNVESITAYQFRMLSLTVSTLFLGAAVTGRKRAEEMLSEHLDRHARHARLSTAGEMAAALAHELNQPLSATISYTRAAQRLMAQPENDPAKVQAALDGAAAQAERAGKIIRTLREFIGKGELRLKPCPVPRLIQDAAALMRPECSRAGVSLEISNERELPNVLIDAIQVQQVLANLIRNAIEALSGTGLSKGGIILSSRRAGQNQVEIEVADNGPGLPVDQRERLFQPFSTTKADGMGLGLSISRTIIEAHGGVLRLAASSSDGCSFRFTLPVALLEQDGEGQA